MVKKSVFVVGLLILALGSFGLAAAAEKEYINGIDANFPPLPSSTRTASPAASTSRPWTGSPRR
jgi:hypothetical protein